jgi:hypothetical protein
MEATCSSDTKVDFQRPTRRHILEDRTLHNDRCESLKSYNIDAFFTNNKNIKVTDLSRFSR